MKLHLGTKPSRLLLSTLLAGTVAGIGLPGIAHAAVGDTVALSMSVQHPGVRPDARQRMAPTPTPPGGTVTYLLTITNPGPSDAQNVTVTDTLDPNLSYVSSKGGCTAAGQVITCSKPTLAAGETFSFEIVVQVKQGVAAGTIIPNVGTAATDTDDTDPSNNSSSAELEVTDSKVDVSIVKTGPGTPLTAGENFTITFEVDNAGPSDATNVVVTDTLDPNLEYVTASGAACAFTAPTLTCDIGDVDAGTGATTIVVTLKAKSSMPENATITNTAEVDSAETDVKPTNNTSTIDLVGGTAPPAVTKADVQLTKKVKSVRAPR
ncbi:hypothetical protein GCM10027589_13070 [Actinocorallia lasiicapitis]